VRQNVPAYIKVADYLRALLGTADRGVQPRLPTEAELTLRFRVSRHTVRRAYSELVIEGLVQRAPGKGSYAVPIHRYMSSVGFVDDLLALANDRVLENIASLRIVADTAAATKLGLPHDEVGFMAYKLLHEGVPYGVTSIYLPPFAVAALEDVPFVHHVGAQATETVIATLNRTLPTPVGSARQTILAVTAPADIARTLGCEVQRPLVNIEYLYFDTEARPLQLNVNYFNPDRYEYRAQLYRWTQASATVWSTAVTSEIARLQHPDDRAMVRSSE
jgi:GntR family transcriptional regulator